LIGISAALIGGAGWESADSWAALFACGLIATNGFLLLRPALHEIMDTAPGVAFVRRVEAAARAVPGVRGIEKCYIRKMGLSFYVDLHASVDAGITVREGHDIAHRVKRAIQEENSRIADVLVHIEPE
jgi:divalent metal cation (Fe/Co/Zn/Cd) transporter